MKTIPRARQNFPQLFPPLFLLFSSLFFKAMFGSRKVLRKGKKIQRKIIFFSLDDMENMMEKKYEGKY